MVIGERYELEKDEELRVEVELQNNEEHVFVELQTGQAEIFGTEMVIGTKYRFNHGAKFSVFTYHGCSLTVYGQNKGGAYQSKEHPMIQYLNVHSALEDMRVKMDDIDDPQKSGPKVMVVGPQDVGKSTLCQILVNYTVRQSRRPIFVDLDISQCSISLPGSIAATLVERPTSIEEGFPQNAPMVYHFGHTKLDNPASNSGKNNTVLYDGIVSEMAGMVKKRLAANKKVRTSGVIINTLAYKKENKGSIINIAKAFEVDVILVLDKEPLYMALQKEFRTETRDMKIVWLPKSNGVVERGEKERSDEVHNSIKRYFYGFNNTLIPHTYDVKIDDLKDKIWKIGAPGLPDSCMPLGFKAENKDTKPVPVSLTDKELRNHVMAVSHATDEKKICETNIAGFVVVTEVDKTKDKIKILSPQPKPLPPTLLVLSPDIRFLDR